MVTRLNNGAGQRVGPRVAPQLILGLAVMLLGLLLVLENVGMVEARRLVRFWPVLLVGLGLARLYLSLRSHAPPAGHVLVLLGLGLLLVNLGMVRVSLALAAFLLAAGGVIAWRATRRREEPTPVVDPGNHLELFAFMSYVSRSASNPAFRGGRVSAVMAGCEVDLRRAAIEDGEAVVDVFAFWGGIEIKVPEDWTVEARAVAMLGAFEDNSRRPVDDRKKLIVTGTVVMGGVEVKN